MAPAQTYPRYTASPYYTPKQTRIATIFQPDDYTLSIMMSLPAQSLRLLVVMAARVNGETGKAECTMKEIRDLLGGFPCNISRSKATLVRSNLIAYAEKKDTYFINDKVAKTFRVTL